MIFVLIFDLKQNIKSHPLRYKCFALRNNKLKIPIDFFNTKNGCYLGFSNQTRFDLKNINSDQIT